MIQSIIIKSQKGKVKVVMVLPIQQFNKIQNYNALLRFDSFFNLNQIIDTSNMNNKQKENAICEAKIMKDLKHPSIIKYYESFFENM